MSERGGSALPAIFQKEMFREDLFQNPAYPAKILHTTDAISNPVIDNESPNEYRGRSINESEEEIGDKREGGAAFPREESKQRREVSSEPKNDITMNEEGS
ncbi:hypothetical protein Y032_0068g179 [Ancylostoma ceylanicum]|uniref:Uncharacterized protein n=1 Tax=Ancylostoma ceylanicum TaxID=53326 RepID=A0A016TYK1_9BILA|nr:hypothetical protein Y032_0068g179 [Ancylostoma ceylanicum]